MLKILYFVSLVTLILLTLLFVLAVTVRIKITPLSFKVSVFHLPLINLKGEKLYQKLIKEEEKIEQKPLPSPLYFHLLDYLHFDLIEIDQSVDNRKDIEVILKGIEYTFGEIFPSLPFHFQIKNDKWDTTIKLRIHFYIGTIILNYLSIRRQIKHGQTSKRIHAEYHD